MLSLLTVVGGSEFSTSPELSHPTTLADPVSLTKGIDFVIYAQPLIPDFTFFNFIFAL